MSVNTNKIGTNILLLGFVSFLADTSTHMIKPILPMFIAALGGGGLAVGTIGGLTDALASLLKVFSGHWADRIRRCKPFIFFGYLTSGIFKLLFPLSTTWQHMLVLMPMERTGKGLREAPRDALIAASSEFGTRGRGFGFHRAMDTAGSVLGSLLAFVLIAALAFSIKSILFISALVAFSSVVPIFFVREQKASEVPGSVLSLSLKGLPRSFRLFLVAATVYSLGNFTYMFLILRATQFFSAGLSMAMPILLYILINVAYAALSYPSGLLSDQIGRKKVLIMGYALFAITCLGLAVTQVWSGLALFFGLYGVHRALTDGAQRALVADLVAPDIRGTALGAFHTATGLAAFPASIIAGILWQIAPLWTFLYGSVMGFAAAILLTALIRSGRTGALSPDPSKSVNY